jgi:hypothetical protein
MVIACRVGIDSDMNPAFSPAAQYSRASDGWPT